jgi:hypothetical protein
MKGTSEEGQVKEFFFSFLFCSIWLTIVLVLSGGKAVSRKDGVVHQMFECGIWE